MPTKKELLDRIQAKADKIRAEEDEQQVDWAARREWWIKQVSDLFDHLIQLLEPVTHAGNISAERISIELSEEQLGQYKIDQLSFKIGHKKVVLKPVASVIFGGVGRIDLAAPRGSARLILASPDGSNAQDYMTNAKWHVTAPGRAQPLEVMDDEIFLEMFSELIDLRSH